MTETDSSSPWARPNGASTIRSKALSKRGYSRLTYFQDNLVEGRTNKWSCRAGARYVYICEDGLVHYCSQQRGTPGTPLENYTVNHIREPLQHSQVLSPGLHGFLRAQGLRRRLLAGPAPAAPRVWPRARPRRGDGLTPVGRCPLSRGRASRNSRHRGTRTPARREPGSRGPKPRRSRIAPSTRLRRRSS